MSQGPKLAGITVLDLSTVGPASRCTRILADYGATVVKIGAPPRKSGVQTQPAFYAYSANRQMKQVRLDLKAPEGRDAFLRLAERADVVIESYRPGVVDRLGIGFEAVRARSPGIVYCSTSGYGQDGPASSWAGHDINYLAVGGYLACSGPRGDGGPPLPGATIADSTAGGMHAVIAILAALRQRDQLRAKGAEGEGEYLDVSVADGVLTLTSLYIDEHLATGAPVGWGHSVLTGRYAFYDTYEASDGKWLAVGAIEAPFFANLCNALGLEKWIPHQMDDAAQDEIRADFREAFKRRGRDSWVAELAPANTCVAPVYEIGEIADDSQYRSRGAFSDAHDQKEGTFRQVAPVLAGMQRAPEPVAALPADATHTDELLGAAGLGNDELERLRAEGVIA